MVYNVQCWIASHQVHQEQQFVRFVITVALRPSAVSSAGSQLKKAQRVPANVPDLLPVFSVGEICN
jgi:hypothetical protein